MENSLGKTIQIYLPDGTPRSIKIAEITSRTIQAVQIPRSKLEEAFQREELKNVGIYFLIGYDDDENKGIVYIGEAEECLTRIKQHNKLKDFWNTVIVVISKTQFFTKTHIRFLEYYCYEIAKKADRYKIENTNIPAAPFISEAVKCDLYDNFETIKILLSTLGFPIFEQIKKPINKDILTCKGKNAVAIGEYREEGLVIFKGSTCNVEESKTAADWITKMRKRLLEDGTLIKLENLYEFHKDHIFNSPSAAAAVVLGRSANGWDCWRFKDGRTLSQIRDTPNNP